MRILPVSRNREAQSCPSPLIVWQTLLTYLLDRHYGLSLNDTQFGNDGVIQQHIDAGVSLADALNFHVEKYELVRIDRPGFSIQHQSPFIGVIDILRARRETGLMHRNGYKRITHLIAGNAVQEQHS
ncbi:TA system toxin CbtA family protein [Enterobacter kobei]|uniref:TA system toxin CbtA family protein n=1 Tax=Enterobacter kobei TaxID=208224 RepID=UPI00068188A8|nr:TA system toxin CbtA family protein [Enterobacter kobei]